MKIVVSTGEGGLDDMVNPYFGRCQTFTTVEVEGKVIKEETVKVHPNEGAGMAMGAGIRAGQAAANLGAQVVITGSMGPNAFGVAKQAGMRAYSALNMTVRKAIEAYLNGALQEISAPGQAYAGKGLGPGRGGGRGMGMGRGRGGGRGRGRGGGRGRQAGF